MKINLGSGSDIQSGYVSCDYDAATNPDFCFNLETDTFPFDDNSVDAVMAHHIFEHLGEGYFHFLKELYRVCANNCEIDILVPHHRSDYFFDDPTHKRPITVDGLKMLSKLYNQQCLNNNEGTSKIGMYLGIDFEILKFRHILNKEYQHLLRDSEKNQEQIQFAIKNYNNAVDMVHIFLIVKK
jgi:predicted SAM-dependent methyltransferase